MRRWVTLHIVLHAVGSCAELIRGHGKRKRGCRESRPGWIDMVCACVGMIDSSRRSPVGGLSLTVRSIKVGTGNLKLLCTLDDSFKETHSWQALVYNLAEVRFSDSFFPPHLSYHIMYPFVFYDSFLVFNYVHMCMSLCGGMYDNCVCVCACEHGCPWRTVEDVRLPRESNV